MLFLLCPVLFARREGLTEYSQHRGRNYLIPIGAGIKDALDLKYKAVDAGYVLDGMVEAGNDFNMVILDACRNNPYRSLFRSSSRGLARMSPARGTLVLYATEPGSVASDGKGRNGIFTKHLLAAMQIPGLEIEQVFKRTAVAVDRETAGAQTPWVEGVVLGHFAFREGDVQLSVAPSPPPPVKTNDIISVNINRQYKFHDSGFRQPINRRKIDSIVIIDTQSHNIKSEISGLKAYDVTYHYLIDRYGDIWLLVEESNIAFHTKRHNDHSIGIGLIHSSGENYPKAQINSLASLLADIVDRRSIEFDRIFVASYLDKRKISDLPPRLDGIISRA